MPKRPPFQYYGGKFYLVPLRFLAMRKAEKVVKEVQGLNAFGLITYPEFSLRLSKTPRSLSLRSLLALLPRWAEEGVL